MMKKRIYLAGIVLICVIGLAVLIFKPNRAYGKADFVDNGRNDPYSQGIALDEMDFDIYKKYIFPKAICPVLIENWEERIKIALPCDIHYYAGKEDAAPAVTLAKGTEVYIFPPEQDNPGYGYGLTCWPDYQKGWRYGQPFVTDIADEIDYDGVKYFVRTKELENAAKAFWKANCRLVERDGDYWTYGHEITRTIDRYLYDSGAFCSGEIERGWNVYQIPNNPSIVLK